MRWLIRVFWWFIVFVVKGYFGFFTKAGQIWGKWFSRVPWERGKFGNFIICVAALFAGAYSAGLPTPFPYIILVISFLIMAKMWENRLSSAFFDVQTGIRVGFFFHSSINGLILMLVVKFFQHY